MKQYNIVSIISDKEVLINAPDLNGDKVFVYGEEVNDFRTVDYEGLTTLNISATQELSKLVTKQREDIDALTSKMESLQKQDSIKQEELDEFKQNNLALQQQMQTLLNTVAILNKQVQALASSANKQNTIVVNK